MRVRTDDGPRGILCKLGICSVSGRQQGRDPGNYERHGISPYRVDMGTHRRSRVAVQTKRHKVFGFRRHLPSTSVRAYVSLERGEFFFVFAFSRVRVYVCVRVCVFLFALHTRAVVMRWSAARPAQDLDARHSGWVSCRRAGMFCKLQKLGAHKRAHAVSKQRRVLEMQRQCHSVGLWRRLPAALHGRSVSTGAPELPRRHHANLTAASGCPHSAVTKR
jgi:hypothetical protein